MTREKALKITETNEAFYVTSTVVNGYNVEMYNYRLAGYNDFKDNDAFELRGLTFVQTESGEWVRWLAMNKFFNLNQCPEWMEEDVRTKKIVRVQDKLDGSLITFVKLPDGTITVKTKMTFESEQSDLAMKVYNNDEKIKAFVADALDEGKTVVFEIVSPMNQIVLPYANTELVLLQVRNSDGTYLDTKTEGAKYGIKVAHEYDASYHDLAKLLSMKSTEEGIEGWIVTFEDGQMAKIKTDWYLNLHGLSADGARENLFIELVLNEQDDDVISQLLPGEKRDFLVNVANTTRHKFDHLVNELKTLRNEFYTTYNGDRKEFALSMNKHHLFGYVMKMAREDIDVEALAQDLIKGYILKKTSSLTSAREWLNV